MAPKTLRGRVLFQGEARGQALRSAVPLGLFGHLDPKTGLYREAGHPLDGQCVKDRILVFPRAKGSTVGSYILYALSKSGTAPAAMLLSEADTIVAVGAIIAEIPTVDGIDLAAVSDGARLRVRGGEVRVEEG